MIESDGESEESEVVHIELDTSRKYYVRVFFWTQAAYLSRVLGTPREGFPLPDVHQLRQPPHRPLRYERTGDYASLTEIKLQEGVKDFYTLLPCYLFELPCGV